jgi:hypothetical protein
MSEENSQDFLCGNRQHQQDPLTPASSKSDFPTITGKRGKKKVIGFCSLTSFEKCLVTLLLLCAAVISGLAYVVVTLKAVERPAAGATEHESGGDVKIKVREDGT